MGGHWADQAHQYNRAMRRALVIVNPQAYTVNEATRRSVIERLGTRLDLEEVETKGPGHATEIGRIAADDGEDLVVVLGGDGTLNETVNGLAGSPVTLGILPGGGANVLARSLGLPRDPLAAVDALLAGLDRTPRRIPLGRADGRYFVANCGVGFDAAVVRRVDEMRHRRGKVGDWGFVWATIRAMFGGYDRRRPRVEVSWVDAEGERVTRSGLFMAVVQNTDPYTYLGRRPMRLCPEAPMGKGLHLFGIDTLRIRTVVRVLASSFLRARHGNNRHVTWVRERTGFTVRCEEPLGAQVDGEYLGERTSLTVEWVPDALSVIA